MFSIKKTLATLLAIVMLIGLTGVAMASSNTVASTESEAILTLRGLGIMVGDEGTLEFREGEAIKRSEFAKVAVVALGLEDVATANSQATKYPDVVSNHWANGFINVSTTQGIVIGDPNGNFRPDDNITYAESMTIIVRMLGYEPSAQAKGAYPGGFLVVGAENGINDKISVGSNNEAVNRGTVAQMIFNALTVKLMEQTGFGKDAQYSVVNKTLLEDKLNVEKLSGVLTANENTYLNGGSSVGEDKVQIGGTTIDAGNVDSGKYLGFNVTAYASENNNNELELIVLIPSQTKNKTIVLDASNIDSLTSSTASYWVNKDTDKNTTNANISSNAQLVYNGKADNMSNLAIPVSGTVTLVDNNRDNNYDIILVNEHRNIVVEDTSSVSYTVTDKYGNASIVLDPEDTSINFTIKDKDGKDVKFEDIKEWDVLSAAISHDGKLMKVTVLRDAVTGTVAEKTEDDVTINGVEYKIAANYTGSIDLDMEAKFYIDIDGKIAALDNSIRISENYAYLVDADRTGNIDSSVEVKLYTKAGEAKIVKLADRVKLDGTSMTDDAVLAALENGGRIDAQLIIYGLNSNNEINSIELAADKSASAIDYYSGQFVVNAKLSDAVYKSASQKLAGIRLDASTIVFEIPNGSTDTDDFAINDYKMFTNDSKYNALIFDMAEDMTASVVIVTNSDGSASYESPILVVDKVTSTNNANGISVDKLYGYQNGAKVELLASENVDISLAQGDIIQYKTNTKGEIEGVTVLFDSSEDKNTEEVSELTKDVTTVYGKVIRKFSDSINVSVDDGAAENFKTTNAVVYKYDSTKSSNNVTVSSAADIQKYDSASPERVFVRIYNDEVKEIVIIR